MLEKNNTGVPMPIVQGTHRPVSKDQQNCEIVEDVGQKEKKLGRHGISNDDNFGRWYFKE